MEKADRPLCRNVIVFERRTRKTLQQRELSNKLHHRFVLLRAIETPGVVSVNGTAIPLEKGDALLVAPYQFHHYLQMKSDVLRWIFISFELERGLSIGTSLSGRILRFDTVSSQIWEQAIHHWISNYELLLPTLDQLLTHLQCTTGIQEKVTKNTIADSWISRVENLILQSIETGWTLEEVARRMGISDRHMRNRFEERTGVSPKDYRANYQLHLALSMMREPSHSQMKIAERSGFQSASVFSRFINRMTGMTPRDLRKQFIIQ